MNRTIAKFLTPVLPGLFTLLAPGVSRAQILETETARLVGKGVLEIGSNFEYQGSSEGYEAALPFALEYGLSSRLEILLEPVAYTAIRPKTGPRAAGVGDLEVTLTFLARQETKGTPALAVAGEVKFPTARSTLIGTGKTDFAGYLIASRHFGGFDTHGNLGYTIVGRPAGSQLTNVFNFAVGCEVHLGPASELYGEMLANTAAVSVPEGTGATLPGTTTPEAPSGEIVGSLGIARYVVPALRLSLGVSVDNNGAVLLRPGLTLRLR
jgi:hypothetical protein